MSDSEKPTEASGVVDGTIPKKDIPVEVIMQRIPIPTPQAGEELRKALDEHEGDATVRDRSSGRWIYVRTRAFIDLKKLEVGNDSDAGKSVVGSDADGNAVDRGDA